MIDVYGNDLEIGDKISFIESYNTHHHNLKTGTVHSLDEDGRGPFAILILNSHIEAFGSYTRKVYITELTVAKV